MNFIIADSPASCHLPHIMHDYRNPQRLSAARLQQAREGKPAEAAITVQVPGTLVLCDYWIHLTVCYICQYEQTIEPGLYILSVGSLRYAI